MMEADTIRIRIRDKPKTGRLPYNSMPRFFGTPADDESMTLVTYPSPRASW